MSSSPICRRNEAFLRLGLSAACILGCATLLLIQPASALAGPSVPPGPPQRIAFVDFDRVVQTCQASQGLKAELAVRTKQYESEKLSRQAKLLEMSDQINALEEDSSERKGIEERFAEESNEYRTFVQKQATEMERAQQLNALEVYKNVRSIVEAIAKEQGFDAVFKWSPPFVDEQGQLDVVMYEIKSSMLLYHAPGTDLTELVLKRLDGPQGAGTTSSQAKSHPQTAVPAKSASQAVVVKESPSGVATSTSVHPREGLWDRSNKASQVTQSPEPVMAGVLRGVMLYDGQGLANCQVQLVEMVRTGTFLWKDYSKGRTYETTTAVDGTYAFENLQPGGYKMRWLPPGSGWWLRFMSECPDVTIKSGEVVTFKEIETRRKVLGD